MQVLNQYKAYSFGMPRADVWLPAISPGLGLLTHHAMAKAAWFRVTLTGIKNHGMPRLFVWPL